MPDLEPPTRPWRRSSHSMVGDNNNCIELSLGRSIVAVRDSKHPDGPVLRLAPNGFRSLIQSIRSD
jgi:hypothetical protein